MDVYLTFAVIACIVAIRAQWKLWDLTERYERDMHYVEWWLRSMENRKADKEQWEVEDAEEM
jgi:hypothetical protein